MLIMLTGSFASTLPLFILLASPTEGDLGLVLISSAYTLGSVNHCVCTDVISKLK